MSQEQKESTEMKSEEVKVENEEKSSEEPVHGSIEADLDNLKQINCQVGSEKECNDVKDEIETEKSPVEESSEKSIEDNTNEEKVVEEIERQVTNTEELKLEENKSEEAKETESKSEEVKSDETKVDELKSEEKKSEETSKEDELEIEDTCKSSIPKECCLNPLKTKETGGKIKRKSRSTRRRLNAMVNNTSLHFSDTDSEGELSTINRSLSPAKSHSLDGQHGPLISVTLDNTATEITGNPDCLSPDEKGVSHSSSYIENLTDVDEIYTSEPETDIKKVRSSLTVDNICQGETDLEDFEVDEEVQSTIYVKLRTDFLQELSGETITTKEGDGPFSVEIRNKMSLEDKKTEEAITGPDIIVLPNTDEEDIDVSEEENLQEACCSKQELLEDLDVLAASQIVMKNINKMENMLSPVKDTGDEIFNDCTTDVEDVE